MHRGAVKSTVTRIKSTRRGVYMHQAKGCRGQEDELSFLPRCCEEKNKSAVRQQWWCCRSRWLHSLWSAAAVPESDALNPSGRLPLTPEPMWPVLFSATTSDLLWTLWGCIIRHSENTFMTKWNLVTTRLSLKSPNTHMSVLCGVSYHSLSTLLE